MEIKRIINEYGREIPFYSDGMCETLWVYRTSTGIAGVVQCNGFEGALECVYDEILKPIPDDEIHEAYGLDSEGFAVLSHDLELAEGYRHQSNSTGSGIVAVDLNGEMLDELTMYGIDKYRLTIIVADEHDNEYRIGKGK
jgi:hypothetical protein